MQCCCCNILLLSDNTAAILSSFSHNSGAEESHECFVNEWLISPPCPCFPAPPRRPTTCWTCSQPSSSLCLSPPPTHGEVRDRLFLATLQSILTHTHKHARTSHTWTHTHISVSPTFSCMTLWSLCSFVKKNKEWGLEHDLFKWNENEKPRTKKCY